MREFSKIVVEHVISPTQLDLILEKGYFRNGHDLCCGEIQDGGRLKWIRIVTSECSNKSSKTSNKILGQIKSEFRCTWCDAEISESIDALYTKYKTIVPFAKHYEVGLLLGYYGLSRFPTKMLKIWDGEALIAVGYFDLGENSVAGILNFYHPDYRQYSLGIGLYLQIINYAIELGKLYFYPGYVKEGDEKFDYKVLHISQLIEEWNAKEEKWVKFRNEYS